MFTGWRSGGRWGVVLKEMDNPVLIRWGWRIKEPEVDGWRTWGGGGGDGGGSIKGGG